MIRTQRDRRQPKLTHHPLAADVDMRWFVTIKTVEEQAIGAWDTGPRGHAIRLVQSQKNQKPWRQYT
jgi:hypothetical protein